jgi:hypothetical protein
MTWNSVKIIAHNLIHRRCAELVVFLPTGMGNHIKIALRHFSAAMENTMKSMAYVLPHVVAHNVIPKIW